MFIKVFILLTSICLITISAPEVFSQVTEGDTTYLDIYSIEEELLEGLEDEEEESKLLDFLEGLKRNPYNLNTVSVSELENIPFLNAIIAKRIIDYRDSKGGFTSKREILKVDGVSNDLYELIKVFLIVPRSRTDFIVDETGVVQPERVRLTKGFIDEFDIRYRSRFQQDLQTRVGFIDTTRYQGSKAKIYNQLNLQYNLKDFNLMGNVTIEKDPGETSLTDFSSGTLELSNYKWVNKLIAGDYSLNFGQGLAMWTSLSFSKGVNTVNGIKKRVRPLRAYTSVNETQFFRGGAAEISLGKFNLIGFASFRSLDASIDTLYDGVTSFKIDGLFRTEAERNRKNAVDETMLGGRIYYHTDVLKLGGTFWTSKFSKDVIPDSTRELYNFHGNKADMIALDYDYIFENMNFYGELARSQSGSIASLNAVQMNFLNIADIVLLYRDYPEDFAPVHSFAFGEKNGDTRNERGFYAGISTRPIRGLRLTAYYDQFKFPYRSFFQPTSIEGNEFLINGEWRAARGFEVYLRYKNENKEQSRTITNDLGQSVRRIDNRNQSNIRTGFSYEMGRLVRIRSRFEYVFVEYDLFGGNNKGTLWFSDLRLIPITGLSVETRLTFFNTDSFDSRVYQYENDLRGLFTNVALFGTGTRFYVLMKYKPFDYLELAAKYAKTYVDGARDIGSGNDRIIGDVNDRLNLGLEIIF